MAINQTPQRQTRSHRLRLVRRNIGLSEKLGMTICMILIFAVGLTSLLNYVNFQRTYDELIRSSYAVMLRDISSSIHYGLGLGLTLPSMDNIPELIRQTHADGKRITFIAVFDGRGETLFHTRPERIGDQAPASWRAALLDGTQQDSVWSGRTDSDYLIGLPLINSFDRIEGALVLAYPRAESDAVFRDVQRRLLKESGAVIAVFGVLSLLCALLVFRGLGARLRRAEHALKQTVAGSEPAPDGMTDDSELEQELASFRALVRDTKRELERRPPDSPPAPTEPSDARP